MKKYFGKLVALAFLAVAVTGAALAQDAAHVVRADIPFSFYAGSKLLPAGEYRISINLENRIAHIEQEATGQGFLLLAHQGNDQARDQRTVLTFKLVGGEVYALSDLRGPDLGLSFRSKGSGDTMKAQNQKDQTAVVIAEAR